MSVRPEASHDKQVVEIWHDDGCINLSVEEAEIVAMHLVDTIRIVRERKNPPAPAPYKWGEQTVADSNPCTGQKEAKDMHCGGGLLGHEMYFKHFWELHLWLLKMFEYHRSQGCKNLHKFEKDFEKSSRSGIRAKSPSKD